MVGKNSVVGEEELEDDGMVMMMMKQASNESKECEMMM
jgi:hypothetical protein